MAVAEDALSGGKIQPFSECSQHQGDLLGGGFQTVHRGMASGSERGTAGLAAQCLDALGMAMLAIANESMNVSICHAEVWALVLGQAKPSVFTRFGAPRHVWWTRQRRLSWGAAASDRGEQKLCNSARDSCHLRPCAVGWALWRRRTSARCPLGEPFRDRQKPGLSSAGPGSGEMPPGTRSRPARYPPGERDDACALRLCLRPVDRLWPDGASDRGGAPCHRSSSRSWYRARRHRLRTLCEHASLSRVYSFRCAGSLSAPWFV